MSQPSPTTDMIARLPVEIWIQILAYTRYKELRILVEQSAHLRGVWEVHGHVIIELALTAFAPEVAILLILTIKERVRHSQKHVCMDSDITVKYTAPRSPGTWIKGLYLGRTQPIEVLETLYDFLDETTDGLKHFDSCAPTTAYANDIDLLSLLIQPAQRSDRNQQRMADRPPTEFAKVSYGLQCSYLRFTLLEEISATFYRYKSSIRLDATTSFLKDLSIGPTPRTRQHVRISFLDKNLREDHSWCGNCIFNHWHHHRRMLGRAEPNKRAWHRWQYCVEFYRA
ncbi:hypothetical protein K491DRAFT_223142 [Lophiostoma macrostomum CBS 122681]|uniref:F-box domain-containing protein n=1 Tax=Lophiostoma macrostomum CBS 122681 TaxID=1314788 RepID=A0A6A6SQN7_9PLEO|nr:hypothetical protein K491DRAFT_223142 [Lophiostoma macrostomum CBS 122681]